MGKIERFLKMHDGHHAFVRIYVPTKIRGYVHLLHGMTEHSGRYDRFCRILSKIGYFVSIHDHRGHGRSVELDGKFGYFADENGFEKVVQDVHEIIQFVRKEYRLERPIIFGHSMGSFIARRYIQLYSDEVKAVVLSGSGAATSLHLAGNHLAKAFVALKGKDVESHQMNKLSFGSFNKKILKRIRAYDNNGLEFDIEMNFKLLESNRYISDGDINTIVVPSSKVNNISNENDYKIITY